MILNAFFGQLAMAGPVVIEPLLGFSSLIVTIGCSLLVTLGLIARTITIWVEDRC